MLTIETITDPAQLMAVAPEWERLDASVSPRLPFTTPLWCLTWWRHHRRDGFGATDHLRVFLLRGRNGELAGVAPMFLTHRPGRGPIRTRELQFFGADPYVTEWRGPICRPEMSGAVLQALSAHIEARAECDWVQWRGLRTSGGLAGWGRPLQPHDKLAVTNYFLRVPDSWEGFRRQLSRNIKESLRKCYNSLARDNHRFELRLARTAAEAPEALDRFFELHGTRAKSADMINHPNVFEDERERRFLRDYCGKMAEAGGLAIFQLVIEGQVVASRIGFVLGEEVYLYFSGYEVAWSKYSIMTTTVSEAIKWAIEHKFKIVNLSTGSDVSKTRWRPEQIDYHGGFTVAASPVSRLSFALVNRLRHGPAAAAEDPPIITGASAA